MKEPNIYLCGLMKRCKKKGNKNDDYAPLHFCEFHVSNTQIVLKTRSTITKCEDTKIPIYQKDVIKKIGCNKLYTINI